MIYGSSMVEMGGLRVVLCKDSSSQCSYMK